MSLVRFRCRHVFVLAAGEFVRCDEPAIPGSPYCAEHLIAAHAPVLEVHNGGSRALEVRNGELR